MKKTICMAFVLLLLVSMLNMPVYAAESFAGGTGTSGDPYQITTWAQLNEVRNQLGSYFKLMNDLTASTSGYDSFASSTANSGAGWEPIGTAASSFSGHFDGNGYAITGLFINRPSGSGIGIFGYVSAAVISNVKLKDVNIKGNSAVGGLAGWAENTSIRKTSVTGTVIGSAVAGGINIGGLVGYQNNGEITISHADAAVSGYTIVGGLVGGSAYGNINNSYAEGNVHGYLNELGEMYPGGEAGGLVGGSYGTITKCYATGTVTGTVNFQGVLVGFLGNYGQITNSFFDTTVFPFPTYFGVGGKSNIGNTIDITRETTQKMQTKSTFTAKEWDFTDIWSIDEGTSYPYFKEQVKVSFDLKYSGGTAPSAIYYQPDTTLSYGSVSGFPDSLTREGYAFDGWFTAATDGTQVTSSSKLTVAADHTLYAHWTGNSISVAFDSTGGNITPDSIPATVGAKYGVLPESAGVRAGYTFAGWYTAATGGTQITSDSVIEIPNTHTLYARWIGDRISVAFDSNGGDNTPVSIDGIVGNPYGALPETAGVRTGYIFAGWYTAKNGGTEVTSTSAIEIPETHTLYAHWTGIDISVAFDPNEGNSTPASITVTVGELYGILPGSAGDRKGYTFAGWFTAATGGTKVTSDSAVDIPNDHVLYAHWSKVPIQPRTLKLTSSVADGKIYTDGRITLTPNIDGGTWEWDDSFFKISSSNPATFTALKVGNSTVTYTVNGISITYNITVEGSEMPATGQDFSLAWQLLSIAGAAMIAGLFLGIRRKSKSV